MPRLARSILPSPAIYHVTVRGVNKDLLFVDEHDYADFRGLFRRACRRNGWHCVAFCLMPNHVHAIIETHLELLSHGMHWILSIYAQRFNKRHRRVGHLYQERFHTKLIRDDEHFAKACDYVFENPVRAGLCEKAGDWKWSGSVKLPARELARTRTALPRSPDAVAP
jgi:REP-associated tyrosine transposase